MKNFYNPQAPMFLVSNIDVQSVSRPKNYKNFFRSGREKNGFIYIKQGKILFEIPSDDHISQLQAEKNDLLFVPKGTIYSSLFQADETQIEIVQFDLASGQLPDYLSGPQKLDLPHTKELIDAFFQNLDTPLPNHSFYYLSRLYELLWKIDEFHFKIPHKYNKLRAALTDIIKNPFENQKVSYYAELCHMSEPNFRRLFREYVGMSPIDYRNDIRLTSARNKLQSGEYNVSEAAYESGFTNLSFFIRLYKKKYGYTPKKDQ